jgi:uncharacterized integral membrane protein
MENNKRGSNYLIKTIIFVIIIALTCLLFFGLGNENKTDLELTGFGFLIGAEVVIMLSTILPGLIGTTNLSDADVISLGVLYGIASVIINIVLKLETMRTLIVLNIAAILVYLILFFVVLMNKKKANK